MPKPMPRKDYLLPATIFLTGACILIIEVVATRILAPHYGNTIYNVSSVISVILAALSIGYYYGGRLADRRPSLKLFYALILVGGVGVALFHVLGQAILPAMSEHLPLTWGSLLSALLLFFVPALILGTLSPFAVKLQTLASPKRGVGSVAGTMFFWSTMGSIVGSLSAGFVLIPLFGLDQIILGTSTALILIGGTALAVMRVRYAQWGLAAVFFVMMYVVSIAMAQSTRAPGVVYQKDGVYEKLTITDKLHNGRPARFFHQDKSSSGAMYLDTTDPNDMVYDYPRYYKLYESFGTDLRDALVIGGGIYSIPRALLAESPDVHVDVSEIEPSLQNLAKRYFKLPSDPRLKSYTDDGRQFLRKSSKRYGLIYSDVYYSYYSIPSHFTTREFFETAKQKLTDDGVFMANLIGTLSREAPSITMSELRTFRQVFPKSYIFATKSGGTHQPQNLIVVGLKDDTRPQPRLPRYFAERLVDWKRFELSGYMMLTDNHAPVDQLTTQLLDRTRSSQAGIDGREALSLIEQQLRYGPRFIGAPNRSRFQDFLQTELEALAPKVMLQQWRHKSRESEYPLKNIIARFEPENPRRIILATHYDTKKRADHDDHMSNQAVPGANDGASGVAVLLEISRLLGDSKDLPLGVDIIFFDGEEGDPGLTHKDMRQWRPLGSTYFTQHLNDLYSGVKPEQAIVLDMVCGEGARIYQESDSLHAARLQTESFWKLGRARYPHIFRKGVPHKIKDDHTPLNAVGIPSQLVIGFNYDAFHTVKDTPDQCDANVLQAVGNTTMRYLRSQAQL